MARLKQLQSRAVTSFNNENAAGGVFTALDRTMSGISMQTRVGDSMWTHREDSPMSVDPATFDANKMVLRLNPPKAGITSDEGLIRVTGYNYHELSHLIYGPPPEVTQNFINTVATDAQDRLRAEGEAYPIDYVKSFVQLILCMHSEHKMLRQYLGIAPYFIEVLVDRIHTVLDHIKAQNSVRTRETLDAYTAASYVLFAGRVYFPKSFREHMQNVFANKRVELIGNRGKLGPEEAWAQTNVVTDELEKGLRKFLAFDFYDSTPVGIRQRIVEMTRVLGRALSPFRAYDGTEMLNVFHLAMTDSEAQSPDGGYGPEAQQMVQQLAKERAKNNQASNESPDVPENNDEFEGQGGEQDESDSGDGEGTSSKGDQDSDQEDQQDGQDSGDGSDGDEDPDEENEDAEGDSEGDDTDDESEDEGEPQTAEGGNAAGHGKGEHKAPEALTDEIKSKLHSLTDYVKGNSQIQNEIKERRRAVVNPTGKQLLTFADRAATTEEKITPEMTLLAKRVSSEFAKLTEDADPGMIRNQSSGRLNIQRAMTGDVELDQLFDRWDEGQTDATEVEMVYLIDASGSMQRHMNNVTRALWVLKRGIEVSSNNSGVTVLSYDSSFEIMSGAEEKEKTGTYKNLTSGGGTSPHRALQAAQAILATTRRSNKLMTILTDGSWQDPDRAHNVIDELNSTGVHTGLMFYPDNYGGQYSTQRAIDAHHCRVSASVTSLSDVLTFTRDMIRSSMRV